MIGDFAFPRPLEVGDTLVFDDMAHYTMVKTTTFNGVPHPDIVLQHGTERSKPSASSATRTSATGSPEDRHAPPSFPT